MKVVTYTWEADRQPEHWPIANAQSSHRYEGAPANLLFSFRDNLVVASRALHEAWLPTKRVWIIFASVHDGRFRFC